ncbi:hypothetical protein C0674_01255 [Sporolactobacillus terrae]|uniref:YozE SAM-like domain-containing protein n=1 Tax=Sporolactobacillus terrae TaxID=269673 RepID=A0ABX5Q3Z7_9BACL|nr:hypothetical protein C0674_01255 [Sporolactobacillus terrae]QAA24340.1 hypothetical protein C0679_01235 [Sporolactobacillus terrae]
MSILANIRTTWFEHRDGRNGAEQFLNTYYHFYQNKEVDAKEFMRFTKAYFAMKNDAMFHGWLAAQ